MPTNIVFRGFGGTCEATNNGDAVVRYDQLADRWLIVMPIFRRAAARPDQPAEWTARAAAYLSPPGRPGQPGLAVPLPDAPPMPEPRPPSQPPGPCRRSACCRRALTRCATRSAPGPIRWGRTFATSSCGRSSPTTRGRPSGPTATTCRRAPATTRSRRRLPRRSTPASSIARRCFAASRPPSSASSSTTSAS